MIINMTNTTDSIRPYPWAKFHDIIPTPYKECKHASSANTWGLTGNTAPVLQYELTHDVVYVNGEKILYNKDDRWWFNI